MQYISLQKRALNAIADFAILYIVLHFTALLMFLTIWKNANASDATSFIVISMILWPVEFIIKAFQHPSTYGMPAYWMLLCLFFLLEVCYYTISDLSKNKNMQSFKKAYLVHINGNPVSTITIIQRSCWKTFSRYLFGLPFLVIFVTARRQCAHDLIVKTIVISAER